MPDGDYTLPTLRLSDKQRRFVDEYFVDMDPVGAFHRAGFLVTNPATVSARVHSILRSAGVREAIQARLAENAERCQGLSPLDVMLDNMRFWVGEAKRAEQSQDLKLLVSARSQAQACAKDAAPYVHPRLQAIAVKSADGGDDGVTQITMTLMSNSGQPQYQDRANEG